MPSSGNGKSPSFKGRLYAVVMAGGAGTRFWPESRQKTPKQFLPDIFGKQTLFEQTLSRIAPVIPKSRVVVVTQKSYASLTAKLGKISKDQIIGEPVGRNTAPCVALAAALLLKKDPDAVLAILPSDHQIGKPKDFIDLLKTAHQMTEKYGYPVTFGMRPDFPHTGYGYLEMESKLETVRGTGVFRLKQFHEKPSEKKAAHYLTSGKFLWNSGMFIWRAEDLWKAVEALLPEVAAKVQQILKHKSFQPALDIIYPSMPNISIDYGLMEKMKGKILTLPADIKWGDLGGWLAFKDLWPADPQGNISKGPVLAVDSRGNFIKAGKRLIAVLGIHDLIVVDTPDALLICPKEKAENIRQIVAALKEKKQTQYL
jgi:mannose-1-phosphate guanylyltransferase